MRIVNTTRDCLLAERARVAASALERLRGLLGRDGLEPGEGLLLRPCNSIHSCFMRFRFDAVFLDRDGQVLHVIHAMRPFRFSRIVWKAHCVLELPAGVLGDTGTVPGDRLDCSVDPTQL